jgi:hypothetical protein
MTVNEDEQVLDDRDGILDKLEDVFEPEGDVDKPLRRAVEQSIDDIPTGPYGKLGEGNIVTAAGYVAVKTGQLVTLPIPGVRQPGFHVVSHGAESMEEFERHEVVVSAASRRVAEFVAEYEVASPSNIDFVTSEVQTVELIEEKPRQTFSTWKAVVDVADRGTK